MDTRVKASVITTMYDMTRYYANGYNDANDSAEARHQTLEELNAQRTEDYKNDTFVRTGANVIRIYYQLMHRNLSATMLSIMQRTEATIHVPSTPLAVGIKHPPYLLSTCRSYNAPMKFRVPY